MHSVSTCNGLVALMKTMVEGSNVMALRWSWAWICEGKLMVEDSGKVVVEHVLLLLGFVCTCHSLVSWVLSCSKSGICWNTTGRFLLKILQVFFNQGPFLQHLSSGNTKKALRKGLSSASCRREVAWTGQSKKGVQRMSVYLPFATAGNTRFVPQHLKGSGQALRMPGCNGRCRNRKRNMQRDKSC